MQIKKSLYQYSPLRWLERILIVVVLLTCLHVWTGPFTLLNKAQAQLPDSAKQRIMLLEETQKTNKLLREIKQILRDETLHVRLQTADN